MFPETGKDGNEPVHDCMGLMAGGLPELRLESRSLLLSLYHWSSFQCLLQVLFVHARKAFILLFSI